MDESEVLLTAVIFCRSSSSLPRTTSTTTSIATAANLHKLTALKKAYGEILLNTAEANAASIVVSERKSLRYQRELSTAKEGALQMLVRLKNMLDSTVSEAEKTCLNQRRKIEELEAQLEEAEDIVKDLREELQQAEDELEKATNKKLPCAREQYLVGSNASQRDITPEDGLNAKESISASPCSNPKIVSTSKMISSLNGRNEGNECMDDDYLHDSDFASVRTGAKKLELYRNGCTQRICAFERNTSDESLSFSGKDDIKSGIINVIDEEAKEVDLTQSHVSDNMCENGKKVPLMDCSNIKPSVLKPFCRKRKREVKYNKGKAPSTMCLPGMPKVDPYCSDSFSSDVNAQPGNIPSATNKNGENDEFFSTAGNDALETSEIMTSVGVNAKKAMQHL